MKHFVGVIFTLILSVSSAFAVVSNYSATPVYADEGAEDTGEQPETPEEPEDPTPVDPGPAPTPEPTPVQPDPNAGSEWSGQITDPSTPSSGENIPSSGSATVVISEVTTTVTPPTTTTTGTSGRVRYSYASNSTTDNTSPEATSGSTEPTETENSDAPETEVVEILFQDDTEKQRETTVYVPATSSPVNSRVRKITLMALISSAIVFFAGIFLTTGTKLIQLLHAERLERDKALKQKQAEEALEKALRARITRAG